MKIEFPVTFDQMKSKICVTCGRTMEWRKRWEKVWDEVKYCSDRCRKSKSSTNYEDQIMSLLNQRSAQGPKDISICPSEILAPNLKSDHNEMEKVRQAARLLVAKDKIEICQKGQIVDPSRFRGPIRLRLKR